MKTRRIFNFKSGFTLMELMVAMAITMIIVTVLVSVTSIAMDTWNRSRAELRASRQAKAMVDTMARDFEGLVTRSGNDYEWLSAISGTPSGGSTNAATLVFFSAATDRYNGEISKDGVDLGGDVSCVGYKLDWKNPITAAGGGSFETFVLNRLLVDPKATFDTLLGKPEIGALFSTTYAGEFSKEEYFVCENVFQFTVSFHVEVTTTTGGTSQVENRVVTIGPSGNVQNFRIKGTGIETTPDTADLKAGKITAVGISLSVLSDAGIEQLRRAPTKASDAEWLTKNSYQYSKLIQLPSM